MESKTRRLEKAAGFSMTLDDVSFMPDGSAQE